MVQRARKESTGDSMSPAGKRGGAGAADIPGCF